MKLSDIKEMQRRIDDGDWVGDIPQLPGVRIKARGIGNREWRALREKLAADGHYSEADATGQLIVRTLLLDWQGLENPDGSEMVFSRERAHELIDDPDLQIVRDAVLYAAGKVANPRAEALPAEG